MATKIYKLYGSCKWAKVQPDQLDLNYDGETKSWRLDLFMTEGSWEIFNKIGTSLKVREDKESGEKYVTFRRQEKSIINDEVKDNGPPYVVLEDGLPLETKIGNGSKVCIEIEVYDSMKGKGHRLVGVVVHDLVLPPEGPEVVAEDVPW